MPNELANFPEKLPEIIQWIIEGCTEQEVRERIAHCWPDDKPKPLIIAAIREIEKHAEANPSVVLGFAIEGTRMIYKRALETNDLKTALAALKQLTQLSGC